jgi:hypothetical protein
MRRGRLRRLRELLKTGGFARSAHGFLEEEGGKEADSAEPEQDARRKLRALERSEVHVSNFNILFHP